MKLTQRITATAGRVGRLPWHLLVPLVFVAVMLLFYPFQSVFEFDSDEGINLMKGMMVLRGYPLYSQIWSDQPPLFTWLLAGAFRLFGMQVNTGRILVLVFSGILVGAAFYFLRVNWGTLHAVIGVGLLCLVPYFLRLSVATMIGLPAISLAMLSLAALAAWHRSHRTRWLVFSAVALALSILTKLFTGILVPVFMAGILLDTYSQVRDLHLWKALLQPFIIWSVVCLGTAGAIIAIFVGPATLSQLVDPHLAAQSSAFFQNFTDRYPLSLRLGEALNLLILAVLGVIFTIRQKNWTSLYLAAWILVCYISLFRQVPLWYHQVLLLTIPAALLAAIGAGEAIRSGVRAVRERKIEWSAGVLALASLGVFAWVLAGRLPGIYPQFTRQPVFARTLDTLDTRDEKLVERIKMYAPRTNWIVTDVPMYAFRAGLPVPPGLTVFTNKRIQTGELTEAQVQQVITDYQPALVLLGRFNYLNRVNRNSDLAKYLKDHYQLDYRKSQHWLYLLNGLNETEGSSG